MIGDQTTGTLDGIVISAASHENLRVTVNGKPARLAIVLDDGTIVAAGTPVAREVKAVVVNSYRNMLKGQGHLRPLGNPIEPILIDREGLQDWILRGN
ncbi:hypothetical protein [Variovorax sp. GT1P44]|uniref:hypothetical protein n=1 Tax=Variovorax sp. GT1P44 TaxID=3443742 RepID=UPI003F45CBE8